MKVVVVGGGVAGVSAALASAREGAETTLLESSSKVGLSKASMPMLLSEGWTEEDLVIPGVGSLAEAGVHVRTNESVSSVQHEQRRVVLGTASNTDGKRSLVFDSLVVSTGATNHVDRLRGLSNPNVFLLGGVSDYRRLSSAMAELKTVAVTGPVPLALRIGDVLATKGKDVKVYCGEGGLSRQFSETAAKMIRDASTSGGRKVSLLEGQVDSILGVGRAEAVVSSGVVSTCDGVVLIPRSAPAAPIVDCERGPDGGMLVDDSMSTSLAGIFAAGDSAELRFKSGSIPARLYSTSRTGGEVAGINAAGGNARASISWAVEQVFFGVEHSSAGLREEEAVAMGLDGASETCSTLAMDRDVDGKREEREILVSMVYDRSTHQIYGLQLTGWRALSFSNTASLIVSLGLTVEQVLHIESPYAPGLSYGFSPIALTAGKIKGQKRA